MEGGTASAYGPAMSEVKGRVARQTHVGIPEGLVEEEHGREAGGLSGAPLKALALRKLKDFARATGGALPLIGCGGIENGVDAFERIRAGASLVQLYTALVYEGPGLAERINGELRRLLALHGFANVADAVGSG